MKSITVFNAQTLRKQKKKQKNKKTTKKTLAKTKQNKKQKWKYNNIFEYIKRLNNTWLGVSRNKFSKELLFS